MRQGAIATRAGAVFEKSPFSRRTLARRAGGEWGLTKHQALIQHDEYFPSGELWQDETDGRYELARRYTFTGKELDISTGLYHFGARYYDARMGIWMSPDPILADYMLGAVNAGVYEPRNLGLFTYAANRPVILVDPSGRDFRLATSIYGDGSVRHVVTLDVHFYGSTAANRAAAAQRYEKSFDTTWGGVHTNSKGHRVIFRINTHVHEKAPQLMKGHNYFEVVEGESFLAVDEHGTVVERYAEVSQEGKGPDTGRIAANHKSSRTGGHEGGHHMGLTHDGTELMDESSKPGEGTYAPVQAHVDRATSLADPKGREVTVDVFTKGDQVLRQRSVSSGADSYQGKATSR